MSYVSHRCSCSDIAHFRPHLQGGCPFCGGRGWIAWLKPPPVKSGKKNQRSPDNLIGHLTSKVSGGYSQYSDDTITEGMNVVFSRGCNRRSSIFRGCSNEIYYKNKNQNFLGYKNFELSWLQIF